jgi:hypothetical protein
MRSRTLLAHVSNLSRRLGLPLVCAACVTLAGVGQLRAEDAPAAAAAPKKAAGKKKTAGKKKKVSPEATTMDAAAAKRRRIGATPAYVVGDSNPHFIDDNAPKIVAFPQEAKAVDKAFADNRRDQLADAEKAARAAKSPDRWRTVLFSLRGLHDRTDPEACFWRVLSFYRLGEIDRARAVRENCELTGKDSSTLNGEDAASTGIPVIGTVAREDQFSVGAGGASGKPTDKPKAEAAPAAAVAAEASPYTGPSPQRYPK